jgi:hypothetical protein
VGSLIQTCAQAMRVRKVSAASGLSSGAKERDLFEQIT